MSKAFSIALIVFLVLANLVVWGWLGTERAFAERVAPAVWLEQQSIGGLSRAELETELDLLTESLDQTLTLTVGDQTATAKPSELGITLDRELIVAEALAAKRQQGKLAKLIWHEVPQTTRLNLHLITERERFDSWLISSFSGLLVTPVNAKLALNAEQKLEFQAGVIGKTLEAERLLEQIKTALRPNQPVTIIASVSTINPSLSSPSQVERLRTRLQSLLDSGLSLRLGEQTKKLTPAELFGLFNLIETDNELRAEVDSAKLDKILNEINKKIAVKAVAEEKNALTGEILQAGSPGLELEVSKSRQILNEYLSQSVNLDQEPQLKTTLALASQVTTASSKTVSPEFLLGRTPGRYIEIDLSAQRMHLMEGDQYHRTFIISTGKWDTPTPIGEFQIYNHHPNPYSKRYGLYMPNWMAITPDGGYGLHQLPYWPDGRVEGTSHLGRAVSHGCVRLGPGDSKYVYDWAANGTKVFIHQ